jgi:triacylglycerol lipase
MAFILRLVLILELCLYGASVLWCRMVIAVPWSISFALAVLVPFAVRAVLVATTFLVAYYQSRQDRTLTEWWRGLFAEVFAPVAFISVYGPFDRWLIKDSVMGHTFTDDKPIILFVHGYVSNRGVWWRYTRFFKVRAFYVAAVDLTPPFVSMQEFVKQLDRAITYHRSVSGNSRLVLIAHSMGGLICRAWAAQNTGAQAEAIITLGSPHNGTRLAPLALGECARQMHESSEWYGQLAKSETKAMRQKIVSIRSLQDNVVIPNESSILKDARNLYVRGVGHFSMTTNRQIQEQVYSLVKASVDNSDIPWVKR